MACSANYTEKFEQMNVPRDSEAQLRTEFNVVRMRISNLSQQAAAVLHDLRDISQQKIHHVRHALMSDSPAAVVQIRIVLYEPKATNYNPKLFE